jgi:hypothetical protein
MCLKTIREIISCDKLGFFYSLISAPSGAWGIHESSRFTSVSLSRTVGRTPWMSDQLIARPLPTQANTVE